MGLVWNCPVWVASIGLGMDRRFNFLNELNLEVPLFELLFKGIVGVKFHVIVVGFFGLA